MPARDNRRRTSPPVNEHQPFASPSTRHGRRRTCTADDQPTLYSVISNGRRNVSGAIVRGCIQAPLWVLHRQRLATDNIFPCKRRLETFVYLEHGDARFIEPYRPSRATADRIGDRVYHRRDCSLKKLIVNRRGRGHVTVTSERASLLSGGFIPEERPMRQQQAAPATLRPG